MTHCGAQKGTLADSTLRDQEDLSYHGPQPGITLLHLLAKRLANVCGTRGRVSVTLKKAFNSTLLETGQEIGW